MSHELSHYVHRFAGKRVLLVGDLILDRYIYGDAERISPEAPVPVLRAVEKRDAVGGAANVASCLAALGCTIFCCGVVGADSNGRRLRSLLREIGADDTGVEEHPTRPTTTKTRLVGLAQHRHRQQLLRVDEEDVSPLDDAGAASLLKTVEAKLDACDVVCIEDYDKGLICAELVAAIVKRAAEIGRPVIVDPARLRDYSRYRDVDLITPNRSELAGATGKPCSTIPQVAAAANVLAQQLNIRSIVVTVDRDGAVVVERDGWRHVRTVPRSVYDNTGAGDAVLAALAAALAAGASLIEATQLANVAGGLEVERFGCVPITADEMLAELRLEHLARNGKLRSVDELVAELGLRRDRGETVAFTNGCFDLIHAGHVDYLSACRREASVLVVGINSDESIRSLDKGDDRPITAFEHRAAVLSALEAVDYVVRFDEPTPENLIRKIRPDVLAKGADWAKKGVVGREIVESYGGKVVLVPLVEGLSTTSIINRIRQGAVPC